jgi:hypothetical protein
LKSQVYSTLRDEWRTKTDPIAVIQELAIYQDAFIDIACGTNLQGHPAAIADAFQRLSEAGAPSSTYPFLMQLSKESRDGNVPKKDVVSSLDVVESFLVRRAVCGHEPTGLHAVFKRLWLDCGGTPNRETVRTAIKKHKTVVWPADDEVVRAIGRRPLYGSRIVSYLLAQYDLSLRGDEPQIVTWIEHVLPESPQKEWWKTFSKNEHRALKDLLANLIPLSKTMNVRLTNKPYHMKRKIYLKDSAFKSAREFANEHNDWTPLLLKERARQLGKWAIERWQY